MLIMTRPRHRRRDVRQYIAELHNADNDAQVDFPPEDIIFDCYVTADSYKDSLLIMQPLPSNAVIKRSVWNCEPVS